MHDIGVEVEHDVVVFDNDNDVGFIVVLWDKEYTGIDGLLVSKGRDRDRYGFEEIWDVFDSNARHYCKPFVPKFDDILFVTVHIPN